LQVILYSAHKNVLLATRIWGADEINQNKPQLYQEIEWSTELLKF